MARVPFRSGLSLIAVLGLLGGAISEAAEPPSVVASILPVHALVAGVMAGIGEPHRLVKGSGSPHDFHLRPSDSQRLREASLVFWIGPSQESFLVQPLKSLGRGPEIVTLIETVGLRLLTPRAGGAWDRHAHGHSHGRAAGHDPHIWLDPDNARLLVDRITAALVEHDGARAAAYRANAARMQAEIAALDGALADALRPVAAVPYIVMHDALQYLERRYALSPVGSLTISTDRPPSAKRVAQLRQTIAAKHVRCVFIEPNFDPALARTLIEGTAAKIGQIDPEGLAITPSQAAYGLLMRNLAGSLIDCLRPAP